MLVDPLTAVEVGVGRVAAGVGASKPLPPVRQAGIKKSF